MNVTKSKHYLFTKVICTNNFEVDYVKSWAYLKSEDSTAVYSTKHISNSEADSYPVVMDVFCTKKTVNEVKLYTFKEFALKIDWYKEEVAEEVAEEVVNENEKKALLDLYETLKSSLVTHSERYHTRQMERFGGLSLDNPPTEVITGTDRPFNECSFEDKGVGKAFEELCKIMENNFIDGK